MKTSATNRRLRVLITSIKDRTLLPRPDFQRRLVWSMKHKIAFVETVLENFPFPEIYVAAGDVDLDTGMSHELLVDGQQRLDTLFQYFNGSETLLLPKSITPYKELTPVEKNAFLDYEVVVRDLGNIPIEEVKAIFQRINSTNYALNPMEIHNSQFSGELIKFAEKLAELPFWEAHKVFSANEIRRMLDMQFMLSVVVTIMSTYFNRNIEIEKYLERYNDEFPHKQAIEENFLQVLSVIDTLNFDSYLKTLRQADLFTLIVELYSAMFKHGKQLDLIKLNTILNHFFETLTDIHVIDATPAGFELTYDSVFVYRKATLQATNDRNNRIARGEVIRNLIDQCVIVSHLQGDE